MKKKNIKGKTIEKECKRCGFVVTYKAKGKDPQEDIYCPNCGELVVGKKKSESKEINELKKEIQELKKGIEEKEKSKSHEKEGKEDKLQALKRANAMWGIFFIGSIFTISFFLLNYFELLEETFDVPEGVTEDINSGAPGFISIAVITATLALVRGSQLNRETRKIKEELKKEKE